jgi:L-amino acid N-acyltransferase YncA
LCPGTIIWTNGSTNSNSNGDTDIDEVIQLSRRLETDSMPCSDWGLNSISAAQLLQNPCKKSVVALMNNSVVGIGTVTRGQPFQQHLAELSIAVDLQFRKNGVARNIVSQLEVMAKEDGIELLKAHISTDNLASRRLFESLDYEHRATLFSEFKSQEFGEIDECV